MGNDLNQLDEKALRELFESVGPDVTPPPGFEERLRLKLLERLRTLSDRRRARRRVRVRAVRAASIAAAGGLLAVVIWWLAGGGVGAARADFAEVLRRVRQAASVAFDQVLQMPGRPEVRLRVVMARPGRTRVTWPNGRIDILDHAQGRGLVLKPDSRKATLKRIPSQPGVGEPLEDLERIQAQAGRAVGVEKVAGVQAVVYEVARPRGTLRIFVDPQRELPVRIESVSRLDDGGQMVTILENFSWNEPVSDAMFSLNVPAGYAVEGGPSEAALLDLLRTCAGLGSGSFPDSLDDHAVLALVLRAYPQDAAQMRTGEAVASSDIRGRAKEALKSCLPGLAFVEQARRNGSWRYAGRGVWLGDAAAAVCWWRPSGSTSFRVVYGNLQVRDVAPGQMPTVEDGPTAGDPPQE